MPLYNESKQIFIERIHEKKANETREYSHNSLTYAFLPKTCTGRYVVVSNEK